jgi:hypothetical protein
VPLAVVIIWIVALAVAYFSLLFVVPLLLRIVRAARKIEAYTRDTRQASRDVTVHLDSLPALDRTRALLGDVHATGGEIAQGTEALAGLLARRAGASK